MEISNDTLLVIEALDNFSEGTLRKKNDFTYILEISASFNLDKEFSEFVFTGKVLWNLFKTIKKPNNDQESLIGVQKEFEKSLESIRALLFIFQSYSEESFQNRLQITYLELTKGCVLNIVDLCHDFGKFKDMQTKIKSLSI